MMEQWNQRIDQWIHQSYQPSPEVLGLCRITYALFNLFFLFHFSFSWIAEYPDTFYHAKPGLTFFFTGFPPKWVLHTFNIALSLFHFFLLVGWYTRWASILSSAMLIISFSFVFAFGNTYHVVLWILFPAVMAFSNWGAALSLDALHRKRKKEQVEHWPITLMSIFIGFAFFTSGFSKLLGGWLQTGSSATWQYFHIVRNKVGRDLYFSDAISTIQFPGFWEALDWLVVGFEVGFLLAIFWPRVFRFFIGLAIVFHFSNMLILNISFSIHLVIFMVFLHWNGKELSESKYLQQLLKSIETLLSKHPPMLTFLWLGIYLLLFFSIADHSRVDQLVWVEGPVYTIALVACVYYFGKGVIKICKRF